MRYFLLLFFFLSFCLSIHSQAKLPDSVLEKLESKLSRSEIEKIKKEYDQADEMTKSMMISVYSMPMSSKSELIDNYKKKKKEIVDLKKTFEEMIPKDYFVFLELKESDKIAGMVESIDLQIFKKNDSDELNMIEGDWDIQYGSERLDELLDIIDWDRMTLLGIKNIMQTANCISIQNGEYTEIGFARSGLGKYFYILFPKKLSKSEINTYNDGCKHIYYKDNVVLKYVGGMAGPQCFTD